MTSRRKKYCFYHFCFVNVCLDIFLENFFHVCKANTNTDKSAIKKIAISCCDV